MMRWAARGHSPSWRPKAAGPGGEAIFFAQFHQNQQPSIPAPALRLSDRLPVSVLSPVGVGFCLPASRVDCGVSVKNAGKRIEHIYGVFAVGSSVVGMVLNVHIARWR